MPADELRVTLAEELHGHASADLGTRLQDIVEEASRVFARPVAIDAPMPAIADSHAAEQARVAADAALAQCRRRLAPKHALHLVRPDHALLVVSLADSRLRAEGARPLAAGLHDELE